MMEKEKDVVDREGKDKDLSAQESSGSVPTPTKKDDDYVGNCTSCGVKDVEICSDTGWCEKCQKEYADEQDRNEFVSLLESGVSTEEIVAKYDNLTDKASFNLMEVMNLSKSDKEKWIKVSDVVDVLKELKKKIKENFKLIKLEVDSQPTDRGVHHLKTQIVGYIIPEGEDKLLNDVVDLIGDV